MGIRLLIVTAVADCCLFTDIDSFYISTYCCVLEYANDNGKDEAVIFFGWCHCLEFFSR